MPWRSRGDGGDPADDGSGGGEHIPSLAARFRIGLGFLFRWVWRLQRTSLLELDPHLLYLYVLCDRGPPTS